MMKLGTRGSPLALVQAHYVKQALESKSQENIEIQTYKTTGDLRVEVRFEDIGTKGVFTKELDEALLSGQIDFAVHSMKDLPSELPEGLSLVCVPEREDPRDVWVSRRGILFKDLTPGSKVGTSSMRRKALVQGQRPDLVVGEWRGNVETRIAKLQDSDAEGIFLAYAGLRRMKLENHVTEVLDPQVFVPAAGQGMIAIVAREKDAKVHNLLRLIHDEAAEVSATVQRWFLKLMEGGCSVPLGCHFEMANDQITLTGYLSDMTKEIRTQVFGSYQRNRIDQSKNIAEKLYTKMHELGAAKMLHALKKNDK